MSIEPKDSDNNKPENKKDEIAFDVLEENEKLKKKVNELIAFLYNITNQYEEDFFNDSMNFIQRQNIMRTIKGRLEMTPEVWAIVNKSKEPPTQQQ